MQEFVKVKDKEISEAIVDSFYKFLKGCLSVDVVIVGGGPAGLVCSYFLSKAGLSVVIVERNNAPGGGAWSGGYLMNRVTVRSPGDLVLKEMGIELERVKEGLFVADAMYVCSSLISKTISAGTKILNLTLCEDVVVEDGKVSGVVINWAPIRFMPRNLQALDPIVISAKAVVDGTGHDAVVVSCLEKRGLVEIKGEGPMCALASEDMVVDKTAEVFPGLYVCGMATSAVFGIPRMGPTFGAMYLSGKKLSDLLISKFGSKK